MKKLGRLLATITAAAVLVTTSGITALADIETPSLANEKNYGLTTGIYVDQEGNISTPDLIPEEPGEGYASNDALPSYYNLAELGRVATTVKDQNPLGTCWAHAGCAAAESSMITKGYANTSIDYSETHLTWFALGADITDTTDPMYGDLGKVCGTDCYDNGGHILDVMGAFSRWSGVQMESNAPYSIARNLGTLDESQRYASYAHAENFNVYDPTDTIGIKNALINTGAMFMSYGHVDSYFNYMTSAYYYPYSGTNHAVTLVGWDDSYSRDNFVVDPGVDGAWIVKNSWGDDWGDDGYFYLSYADASFSNPTSIEMNKKDNYTDIYQYDGAVGMQPVDSNRFSIAIFDSYQIANVFTAKNANPLKAVGFYTYEADVDYKVEIYTGVTGTTDPTNGKLVATTTGTHTYAGFHTVPLSSAVSLTKGQKFSVVITFTDWIDHSCTTYRDLSNNTAGISFYKYSSSTSSWTDTYDYGYNMCIKAYTKANSVSAPTNVTATAGDKKVTLKWNAVSGADKYQICTYLNGTYTSIGTTTATSYTATNLVNGTKYGFLVRACVNGTWSPFAANNVVYATPVPSSPKPTVYPNDSKVTLTWNAVPNATTYLLYTYKDGVYTPLQRTTGTVYTVRNLKNGTKYGFLLRALVNGTWTPFTVNDVVYATPVPHSPKPTVYPNDSKVTLTWDAVPNASTYLLYSYSNGKYTPLQKTTGTVYTVRNLKNGTKYGFLLRACVNGAWTSFTVNDVVYATPAIPAPKPTAYAGNSKVTLTWNAIPNATNYMVYSYANGNYTALGKTTGTVYTIRNLANGTKYGFLVRAYVNGTWTSFTVNDVVYSTPKA